MSEILTWSLSGDKQAFSLGGGIFQQIFNSPSGETTVLYYRVGQNKRGQLTFLLVTSERIY